MRQIDVNNVEPIDPPSDKEFNRMVESNLRNFIVGEKLQVNAVRNLMLRDFYENS